MIKRNFCKNIVIIGIILFLILMNGCISSRNGNGKIKDYENGDLKLIIESEKENYIKNSSEIIIIAQLKNTINYDIKFNDNFLFGIGIKFNITTPNYFTFYGGGLKIDRIPKEVILKKGEYLKYKINLKNESFSIIENNTVKDFKYNWNEIGKFSIIMTYQHYPVEKFNIICSNELVFNII